MLNKKILFIICFIIVISLIAYYLYYEDTRLKVSKYEVNNDKLPIEFDNYKIVHISDFHNLKSIKLQNDIVKTIKNNKPDMIVITGDLIDSRRTDISVAESFIKKISGLSSIYYVPGNHEARIKDDYEKLVKILKDNGITVLENDTEVIEKEGSSINVVGVLDPGFAHSVSIKDTTIMNKQINELDYEKDKFTIMLSHRPELFHVYSSKKIDLVFSGHAHGGQFRLPFIGGLFAPGQGVLPKYTSGKHIDGITTMIISRGLGNSVFPFRVNNRPDLVIVTLRSQ